MKTSLINHIFLAMVFVISLNRQSCIAKTIPYSQGHVEMPATVKVKVVDTDKRQRRYIDQFPDLLDVDVSTDELHEHFQNLKRNHHVPHIKYIHMMENGTVKKFRFERKETMAYYIDVEHGAAFEVSFASEGSEDFYIYGTFVSKQHNYLVQPPRDNRSTYTVALMEEKLTTSFDYIKLPDTDANITEEKMQNRSKQTINTREKRQTADYEIEIFFVLDYALYKWTYALTEGENDRQTATVKRLLQLTSFLLNEMDLRYQSMTDYSYTISCVFAGIYIADDPSDSQFAEDHVVNAGEANGDNILHDFLKWGEASLRHFNYDQATLLTGYDIGWMYGSQFVKGLEGVAYMPGYADGEVTIPALCGPWGYSVNEITSFKPSMGVIVAHELGHNFGSKHDGDTNSCINGYVMLQNFAITDDLSRNQKIWQFSSCSQTYFDTYITDLNHASKNCMTARTATGNDDLDPYANDLAGQVYDPDTQCEMVAGKGSFLYRSSFNSDYSTICSKMVCQRTDMPDRLRNTIPWYGTTCGHGKMCKSGHCIESPLAPPVNDEACPFGDTPYIVPKKTLSCSDLLGSPASTYNCYHEPTRQHCCATCEAIKKTNTAYKDCDYGDKKSYCVGMSLQLCRNNFEVCCKTCQDIQLDIPGCPWGDEYTDCTQSHCTNDFSKCCQTCAATNTALTTAATSTTSTSKPLPTAATSTTTTSKPLSTAATSTKATDPPSATGTIKTTAKTADTTTTTSEPVARISTTNTLIILNFIIHHVIIGLFIGI